MNEGATAFLQKIIDARPAGVRQLFLKRGITAEPTPATLAMAYDIYGLPFVGDLVNIVVPDYDGAEGDTPVEAQAATTGAEKKAWYEVIFTGLHEVSNVLNSWGVATGKTAAPTPAPAPAPAAATPAKNNTMLYLGIGIVTVIILVVLVIIRKK
jgi:hypothetical protein